MFVEDRSTALAECGDVLLAIEDGALTPDRLETIASLIDGSAPPVTGRSLVKTAGVAWEDLAIARAIAERQR